MNGGADVTGIVSYNEWHEGSEIEPALPWNCAVQSPCYADFTGAYGRSGTDSENAYVDRTKMWSGHYKATGG